MKSGEYKKPAQNVDEYLATVPHEERAVLEDLRQTIRTAAPMADEVISYRIPSFKYHGPLVFFAAFKDHCSLYVVSKSILERFSGQLKPFDISRTTIHFAVEHPVPAALVEESQSENGGERSESTQAINMMMS